MKIKITGTRIDGAPASVEWQDGKLTGDENTIAMLEGAQAAAELMRVRVGFNVYADLSSFEPAYWTLLAMFGGAGSSAVIELEDAAEPIAPEGIDYIPATIDQADAS